VRLRRPVWNRAQRNAGLFDDAPIDGDLAAHVLGELLWNARRVVDVRFRG
jgi:hypothetical protein